MAKSGSFQTSGYTLSTSDGNLTRYLVFEWTEKSQSVSNNSTVISWTLKGGGTDWGGLYTKSASLTINGSVVFTQSGTVTLRNNTVLASGETTIPHGADGTKSFAVSAEADIYVGYVNSRGSGTFTLDTIARASSPSLSVTSFDMGKSVTIYTNRKSTTFTHTLRYVFGTKSGQIQENVGDSFVWTVPYSLAEAIKTAKSGSGTIYCKTYQNGTQIGDEQSVSFTANVPNNETTKPTMNLSLSPTGSLPAAFSGLYVQGKTALRVVFNASSTYSTVKSCTLTVEGKTYTGDTVTSSVISGSGNIAYTCTVTDTRGYSRQIPGTINVLPYTKPYLSDFFCNRVNASWQDDSGGLYVYLKFTKNFSSVNGNNTCRVYRRHKIEGGSYGSETLISESGSFNNLVQGITTDPEKAYQVQIILRDDIGESTTYTFDLPSQFHTMHLREGGKGIAFGKRSVADLFECSMDAKLDGMLLDSTERTKIKLVRCFEYSEIGTTEGGNTFFSEWLKMICREHPGRSGTTFVGLVRPNSYSFVICTIYNTSAVKDGLPQYCGGVAISAVDGNAYYFGTNDYTYSSHTKISGDRFSSAGGNTGNTSTEFSIPYPAGFTYDNCHITGFYIVSSWGTRYANYNEVNLQLEASGIKGSNSNPNLKNRPITVYLEKNA